jgi:dienelactone hydrolase
VQNLSPSSATLGQIKAVANVLVKDMANVHSSLQAQKDDIQQRLGGGGASSGGGTALTMTTAELTALAKMHGISVDQERANATAAGYTIR